MRCVWFAKRVGVVGKYINGIANYSPVSNSSSSSSSTLINQSINQSVDQPINQYFDIAAALNNQALNDSRSTIAFSPTSYVVQYYAERCFKPQIV